jgi:hypothetical protein
MNKLYFCKIAQLGSGLCNQLFALITGIILASKNGKEIVIVGAFLNDYNKKDITPISEIINLNILNYFLKLYYNIVLLDRFKTNISIHSAKYGTDDNYIDITNKIKEKYLQNNTFCINTNVDLNNLAEKDPFFGKSKHLEIEYLLNDNVVKERYEELNGHLKTKVEFNLQNNLFIHTMEWINHIDRNMFDNILQNITFVNQFCIPREENKLLSQYTKINVIHLRLEPDAIKHWSRQNNMSLPLFKNIIENKYINIINKYINKKNMNILLTYSTENGVIDFLKKNGYNYYISSKNQEWGRELNAIKDTAMIDLCNNIFIGNFNLEKLNGSSLSYFLLNKMKSKNINVKKFLIDLDHILVPEQIYS